ncbi:hypothetical protein NCCP1664_16040 [Zafaria cholistanensis]|uniref:DUF3618 domain-containing protein n=1 Tax=Zafaria cholistanensis TaxID=1682741 RepID=A0A5A7NTH0_9MICC|nr:DUF3618 domain-containing protein [Zafaria cholistanensis]GER23108.1 hypothetical protein NCCP1664_16040 [Zafaria cholistanensis]
MSQTPEEIRAEIERTRREVGGDVDALAQKVSPSAAVDRQKTRVRHGLHRLRENVMGAADDVGTSVGDAAHRAGDAAHRAGDAVMHTPEQTVRVTRGNPLAAGLVAFGVGAIVSSLLPPTEKEKEAAALLKEKVEPVAGEVRAAVSEVAHDLQEPAQEAAAAVKETATESFETVRGEAQSGAEAMKEGGTSQ